MRYGLTRKLEPRLYSVVCPNDSLYVTVTRVFLERVKPEAYEILHLLPVSPVSTIVLIVYEGGLD